MITRNLDKSLMMKSYEDIKECPYKSASTLLKFINEESIKKIPKHILKQASERGTSVHDSISHYLLTNEWKFDWQYSEYIEAFKAFEREHEFEVYGSEMAITDSNYKIKGIVDAFGILDDEMTVIDFKTGSKLNMFDSVIQLTMYALLMESQGFPLMSIRGKILQLKKDGSYQLIPIDLNPSVMLDYKNIVEAYAYYQGKEDELPDWFAEYHHGWKRKFDEK